MKMMTCVLMGAMVLGLSTAGAAELAPVGFMGAGDEAAFRNIKVWQSN
jgi:hypothetical protein